MQPQLAGVSLCFNIACWLAEQVACLAPRVASAELAQVVLARAGACAGMGSPANEASKATPCADVGSLAGSLDPSQPLKRGRAHEACA
jgi:hypothetical protein